MIVISLICIELTNLITLLTKKIQVINHLFYIVSKSQWFTICNEKSQIKKIQFERGKISEITTT
jgi:hypothetical protein